MSPRPLRLLRLLSVASSLAALVGVACSRDGATDPSNGFPATVHTAAIPDTLLVGQQVVADVAVLDDRGDTIMHPQLGWTNSAPSIVRLDTMASGDSVRVSGLRPGHAAITAQVMGGTLHSPSVQDTIAVVLAGARFTSPEGSSVQIPAPGDTIVVSARALGAAAITVDSTGLAWRHDSLGPVHVTPFPGADSAQLIAVAYGNDTVSVTAPDCVGECTASLAVQVGHGIASITISPATDTIGGTGDTARLVATASDAHGTPIAGVHFAWSSADSTIATVDSTGLLTSVAAGSTQVTASAEGAQGSATIVVASGSPPPPPPGKDIIVFNDMNLFMDEALEEEPNNDTLVKNIVSYTASGPRDTATTVWLDYGHGALCDGCLAMNDFQNVIDSAGYTLQVVHNAQGALSSIPANVKVIFLWTPTQAFTIDEVNALKQFAQDGGRIVFVGEFDGYYGDYFPVENQFLADMGAQMTNIGGDYACTDDLPASSLRTTQVTTNMTALEIMCSSEIAPGPHDFVFAYDRTGEHALAGVAAIDTTPILANRVPTPPRIRPAQQTRRVIGTHTSRIPGIAN